MALSSHSPTATGPPYVFGAHNQTRILNLTSRAWLRAGDGSSILLLAINRQPGYAEDCGVAGFTPTTKSEAEHGLHRGERHRPVHTAVRDHAPPAPSSGSSMPMMFPVRPLPVNAVGEPPEPA